MQLVRLPLLVVEQILATVPLAHKKSESDTGEASYVPLINVLSPRLVPTVLAAVIVDCGSPNYFSDSLFNVDMCNALVRLFGNPDLAEYSKFVLYHIRRALVQDMCMCRERIVDAIATVGNLALLIHVSESMALPDLDLGHEESPALASAIVKGHANILEWWTNNGHSLKTLDHDHILSAAGEGHLSVLIWWSKLEPTFHENFPESDLFYVIAGTGHVAILWWWKERFGMDHVDWDGDHWAHASVNGHRDVLDFAKANDFPYPDSIADCIDGTAANGHVHVLEWWYHASHSGETVCDFNYSVRALDGASANGHVQVLDFFAKSGLELRFTPSALQSARKNGRVKVVEWWLDSRLMLSLLAGSLPQGVMHRPPSDFLMLCAFGQVDLISCDELSTLPNTLFQSGMEIACQFGQMDVLDLLHGYDLLPVTPKRAWSLIGRSIGHNQPASLRWCLKHLPRPSLPFPSKQDRQVLSAIKHGYTEVLDVLLGAGLFKADSSHIVSASSAGMLQSLDYLSAIKPICSWGQFTSDQAWERAARAGHVQVLAWLFNHGVPLTPSDSNCIDGASAAGHWLVLEWWSVQALPFTFSQHALVDAVRNKHKRVMAWWVRSGRITGNESLGMLSNALAVLEDCP